MKIVFISTNREKRNGKKGTGASPRLQFGQHENLILILLRRHNWSKWDWWDDGASKTWTWWVLRLPIIISYRYFIIIMLLYYNIIIIIEKLTIKSTNFVPWVHLKSHPSPVHSQRSVTIKEIRGGPSTWPFSDARWDWTMCPGKHYIVMCMKTTREYMNW